MEANADQVASSKAAWQTTAIKIERIRRRIHTTSGFLDDAAAEQTTGVVSSTSVQDGRILSPRTKKCGPGNSVPSRATLKEEHHDSLASAAPIHDMAVSTPGGEGPGACGRTDPLVGGELVIQAVVPVNRASA
ncbi:hypothetical protein [Streptomyces sp. PRh5]|uniref:hypothetical protein n=1 Tax=Streptomyces sp. PRh5 TaxID=1158056 RepID=UPI0018E2A22A|nr:hypothetical protein [Streptomyces sp. PRh5]